MVWRRLRGPFPSPALISSRSFRGSTPIHLKPRAARVRSKPRQASRLRRSSCKGFSIASAAQAGTCWASSLSAATRCWCSPDRPLARKHQLAPKQQLTRKDTHTPASFSPLSSVWSDWKPLEIHRNDAAEAPEAPDPNEALTSAEAATRIGFRSLAPLITPLREAGEPVGLQRRGPNGLVAEYLGTGLPARGGRPCRLWRVKTEAQAND